MRIPRIFTEQPLITGAEIELPVEAVRHLISVLRLRPGAPLLLFNGDGGEFAAILERVEGKRATVTVGEFNPENRESPFAITLGIGISRGDRMDWIVQKATELGIAAIVPLQTSRTEVRLKADRAARKLHHWRHVILSACEQSGRNLPPSLAGITRLSDWLQAAEADAKWVLHHRTHARLADHPQANPATAALLIGPEGGLDSDEIALALAAGFTPLALGPRVLRTETAPLTAISILQARWGDLR